MPIDFMGLLSNPEFLQGMGQAGAALSRGESFGEALNPADLIAQIQKRKATEQLLNRILGGAKTEGEINSGVQTSGGLPTDVDTGMSTGLPEESLLNPTPKGMKGPDAVTIKKTADGTKMTIDTPSERNLSTFGTSVPAESVPASTSSPTTGKPGEQLPFWQALLG